MLDRSADLLGFLLDYTRENIVVEIALPGEVSSHEALNHISLRKGNGIIALLRSEMNNAFDRHLGPGLLEGSVGKRTLGLVLV